MRRRVLGLLLLLLASPAAAQTGGLRLVVTDAAARSPLAGVEVVLSSATRQVTTTRVRTDRTGSAEFPVLRAGGGYALEVRLPGYAPLHLQDVRVPLGGTAVLPVGMFPELRETVDVSARREGVDLEDASTTTTFTSEFLEELPVYGRFYQTVLTLAPGVLDADDDGNPNVLGARETDFKTVVGGVANTDPLTGGFLSYLSLESVDALEVVVAGAGAEFGRAQGGFANLVQKQGSNDFEGVAGLLWGGSLLERNGAASQEEPRFDRYQPYLQLSGPVIKDRLWYRLSHEWMIREDPINVVRAVELTKREQGVHADQLTWQVTPRNKLALQVQHDPLHLDNQGVGPTVPISSTYAVHRGGRTTSLAWTSPYSARLFGEGLIALQEHREEVFPQVGGVRNRCAGSRRYTNLRQSYCAVFESSQVSGSYPIDSRDRRQRLTTRGDVTLSLDRGGAVGHRIKAGFTAENERYFRRIHRAPEGTLVREGNFLFAPVNFYADMRAPGDFASDTSGSGAGAYVEDQLRLGSRLTVTAGLRADREGIQGESKEGFDPVAERALFRKLRAEGNSASYAMSHAFTGFDGKDDYLVELGEVLGSPPPLSNLLETASSWPRKRRLANIDIASVTVSPRLAVAWDPFGSGKTKLAATAGRYYDKIFLSVPLLGGEPAVTQIIFSGGSTQGGAQAARVTVVDPNLRTPYQDEVTVSAERELLPETSVKVTYVRRRFRDQLQDVDINHEPGDYGRCLLNFNIRDAPMVPSPGSGQVLVDPYTGETYEDTEPGIGDGRIDDCMGIIDRPGGAFRPQAHRPDGLPDQYSINPGWSQVMVIRNANTADYSGALLELTRRYAGGWGLQASYTWSRAIGDAEAFDQLLGDEPSRLNEERGFLSYDQRHVLKVSATAAAPREWKVGTAVRWESGLPYSVVESVKSFYGNSPEYGFAFPLPSIRERYVTGKRNDRRNPGFFTLDARASREFKVEGGQVVGVNFEVYNLLNDDALQIMEIRDRQAIAVRRFGRRMQVGLRSSF